MKKTYIKYLLLCVLACSFICATDTECSDSSRSQAEAVQEVSIQKAMSSVEIPTVSYFQERKTIARWTKYWDKPNVVAYLYLISYGTIIGYYVIDGKPASSRSYLFPEEKYFAEGAVLSTPDIDGTYGENNPGIRFFTSSGIPAEYGGNGMSYLYTASPLPINVPLLSK